MINRTFILIGQHIHFNWSTPLRTLITSRPDPISHPAPTCVIVFCVLGLKRLKSGAQYTTPSFYLGNTSLVPIPSGPDPISRPAPSCTWGTSTGLGLGLLEKCMELQKELQSKACI